MGITVSHYVTCDPSLQIQVQNHLWNEFQADFGNHNAFLKTIASFGSWREQQKVLFVAYDLDTRSLLGTASIEYAHDSLLTPSIANIYIHPDSRNQGYGKRILQFCEKYIKKKGLSTAYLWCKPNLQSYYERLGYKVIGLPKQMQTRDDSVFLAKSM